MEDNPQTLKIIQTVDIVLISVLPVYFLSLSIAYYCNRHHTSLRVRLPTLVFISVVGLLLFIIFNLVIGISSNRNFFDRNGDVLIFFKLGCVSSQLIQSIVQVLVVAPLFLRLHYIYKISLMIQGFHKDMSASEARSKQILLFIYIIFGSVLLLMTIYFIVLISSPTILDFICACTSRFSYERLVTFSDSAILVSSELFLFFFYTCKLSRKSFKIKYHIRSELFLSIIFWLIYKGFKLSSFLIFDCKTDPDSAYFFVALIYVGVLITLVLFTLLIVLPFCRTRYYASSNISPYTDLIFEFPQALYLWTANHHFHCFLKLNAPSLVNYRPLLADVLRYDFQIEQSLAGRISDLTENQRFSRIQSYKNSLSSQFSMRQNISKEMLHVVKLVDYIQERYFQRNSVNFCDFPNDPEVVENIKEKLRDLNENLDEFLFEFVRPCVQRMLAPEYEKFIGSRQFIEMQKDLETQEAFDWILAQRQQ